MQIQCPKCKQWIEDADMTCPECGFILYNDNQNLAISPDGERQNALNHTPGFKEVDNKYNELSIPETSIDEPGTSLAVQPKQSPEDAVKEFLIERKKARLQTALRLFCFFVAAFCVALGFWWAMKWLCILGCIIMNIGLFMIRPKRDPFSHII